MGWRVWVPPHMSVSEKGNPYHVRGYWRKAEKGEVGAIPDGAAKFMPNGPASGSPIDRASTRTVSEAISARQPAPKFKVVHTYDLPQGDIRRTESDMYYLPDGFSEDAFPTFDSAKEALDNTPSGKRLEEFKRQIVANTPTAYGDNEALTAFEELSTNAQKVAASGEVDLSDHGIYVSEDAGAYGPLDQESTVEAIKEVVAWAEKYGLADNNTWGWSAKAEATRKRNEIRQAQANRDNAIIKDVMDELDARYGFDGPKDRYRYASLAPKRDTGETDEAYRARVYERIRFGEPPEPLKPEASLDEPILPNAPTFPLEIGGQQVNILAAEFETDEGGWYIIQPDSRLDIELDQRGTRVEAKGKHVTHQGAGIEVTGKPFYNLKFGTWEARAKLDLGGQIIAGKITIGETQIPHPYGMQTRYTKPRATLDSPQLSTEFIRSQVPSGASITDDELDSEGWAEFEMPDGSRGVLYSDGQIEFEKFPEAQLDPAKASRMVTPLDRRDRYDVALNPGWKIGTQHRELSTYSTYDGAPVKVVVDKNERGWWAVTYSAKLKGGSSTTYDVQEPSEIPLDAAHVVTEAGPYTNPEAAMIDGQDDLERAATDDHDPTPNAMLDAPLDHERQSKPQALLDTGGTQDLLDGKPTGGPSDNADVKDSRKLGPAFELRFDRKKLDEMVKIVGIEGNPVLHIKLYDQDMESGDQGLTKPTSGGGANEFDVVVKVGQKVELKPHHQYIINNSLLHELRHVTQMQQHPGGPAGQLADYGNENMTVGYGNNKYEIDSRLYGHLAMRSEDNPDGSKQLPAGFEAAQGEALWSMTPGKQIIDTPEGFVEHHGKPSGSSGGLFGGGGGPTVSVADTHKVEAAKAQGTAEGEALVDEVSKYESKDRVELLAALKIEGLNKAASGDSDAQIDSERLRRKYKALKGTLSEEEYAQVETKVAESGVVVPPHGGTVAGPGGGSMEGAIAQLMQILGGGGGGSPSPFSSDQKAQITAAKEKGSEDGAAAVEEFLALSPEHRVAQLEEMKQDGLAKQAQADQLVADGKAEEAAAVFADAEYTRRYRKELKKADAAGVLVTPEDAPAATLDEPIAEDDEADGPSEYQLEAEAEDAALEAGRDKVLDMLVAPSLPEIQDMEIQDAIRAYQMRAPEGTLVDVMSSINKISDAYATKSGEWISVGAFDGKPVTMKSFSEVKIGDDRYYYEEYMEDPADPYGGVRHTWNGPKREIGTVDDYNPAGVGFDEEFKLVQYLDALQRAYARAYGAMWV